MVELTKIDSTRIVVNADEIETIESAFDTTVTLRSGRKIIVRENKSLIIELVISYKRECYKGLLADVR